MIKTFRALLIGVLVLGAACAPAASPPPTAAPTGAPAKVVAPAKAITEASPGQAAPPAASPAASPVPASASQAQTAEWDRLVAAAKQEGTVAVAAPVGNEVRDALTGPFEQRYGIRVEYFGASARDLVPRVRTERGANQYLWDVRIGGNAYITFNPMDALEPLEPALILPEVKDPSMWRGSWSW